MSYNRTVYCSYCGRKGHNRRGCADKKKYIADNPDSYAARREAALAERRKNNPRRCSYCEKSGHNTRKCEVKAKDQRTLVQKLSRQRAVIMEKMIENGLGVGALIEINSSRYYDDPDTKCFLLTSINWKQSDTCDKFHMSLMQVATSHISRGQRSIDPDDGYSPIKVISPVDEEVVRQSFPLEWKIGELYDDERYFSKGCPRQYWHFDA